MAEPVLTDFLSAGVFATDGTGRLCYANDRCCELVGVARAEAVGRPWVDLVHPDDRERVADAWARVLDDGEPVAVEFRFPRVEGRSQWVRVQAGPRRADDGTRDGGVGLLTDTDRRAASAAVMRLVERTPDMVVVIDAEGRVLWANATTEATLGHDRDSRVGTPVLDLVHPDDRGKAAAGLAHSRSGDAAGLTPLRVRVRAADGSTRTVEVAASNMLDEPGVRGIVLVIRDLTERRDLERRVRALEHNFTAAFRHSPVGRALVDLDGRWVLVNEALTRLLGRRADELVGQHGIDVVHPEDRERVSAEIARLRAGEVDSITVDVRYVRPDGDTIWARFTTWFVPDAEGHPQYFASDVTDVTAVHEARDSEDRVRREFETLVEQSSDIITVLDPDGRWRSSSGAGTRLLGHPHGYNPEGGILSLVHPDDLEAAVRAFDEVMNGRRGPTDTLVLRLRTADGDYRFLETAAQNLVDDPAVRGVVLSSRDVTERIEAEEQLREADARLRTVLANSSDVIVLTDETGRINYISPAHERLFGRGTDEVEGTDGLFAIHPDDLERVGASMAAVLSEPGKRIEVTVRVRHGDGHYVDVEAVGQNRTDDPAVRGVIWNIRDISVRLQAEASLREAQDRFAALVDNASDMVTVNSLDGLITYASPSMRRWLGYDPDELLGTQARELMHPDDVRRVERSAFDQFARGVSEPINYRARHRDGSWREVEAIITDLLYEESVRGVVTNARDVTEKRAAERRASELVEILEATNELVILSDPHGVIVYANRSARELFGVREGHHVTPLSSDSSRERLRTDIMPMVRRGSSWSGELDLVGPDRMVIPVAATIQAHRDDDANIVRIATVAHDITALKAAQRQLEFEATHDALTELPNRALFREIGERALARAERTKSEVAVLFLDLDGFKLVNDSFGHDTGDVLLGHVARRLRESVRASDTLARLGGDEFVILCEHPRTQAQMLDLSRRIIDTVSQPFTIDGAEVRVGLSIGIAFSKGTEVGLAELIRDADVALYQAKRQGRGQAQVFAEAPVASA